MQLQSLNTNNVSVPLQLQWCWGAKWTGNLHHVLVDDNKYVKQRSVLPSLSASGIGQCVPNSTPNLHLCARPAMHTKSTISNVQAGIYIPQARFVFVAIDLQQHKHLFEHVS